MHHARQLLRGAREQAARPKGRARPMEELVGPDAAGEEEAEVHMEGPVQVRDSGQNAHMSPRNALQLQQQAGINQASSVFMLKSIHSSFSFRLFVFFF